MRFAVSPRIYAELIIAQAGSGASRKRVGLAAGMTLWLECDFGESVLLFDPQDRQQAKTAEKIAGIRRKKRLSAMQEEILRRCREQFRFQAGDVTAMTGAATAQPSTRSNPTSR